MQQELLELWEQVKFTVLFVTHSIGEAILVGSRMLVLSPHPGQVRAELNTDQYSIENIDDSNFGVLSKKIHGLLFDETHQNDSRSVSARHWFNSKVDSAAQMSSPGRQIRHREMSIQFILK